jgi:hypothetical protein
MSLHAVSSLVKERDVVTCYEIFFSPFPFPLGFGSQLRLDKETEIFLIGN